MLYEKVSLWNDDEYNLSEYNPEMAVFSLKGRKKRPAVIIFPGGGYTNLSPREGEPIAMKFLSKGFQAFVVKYTISPKDYTQPLRDATRAICMVRDNCEKWRVDPGQIAVIGFSAGGHLATSLATNYESDFLKDIKGMEKGKNRPDLLISCYSVITAEEGKGHKGSFATLFNGDESKYNLLSLEKNVHENMPPTFIWHTFEDGAVPVCNSIMLAQALGEKNIPYEMHIYPKGSHGLATVDGETLVERPEYKHISSWFDLCVDWMNIYFKLSEYNDDEYRGGAINEDEI